ncbi:MAG: alpha-glucan family phosphorylase [Burkholderiales bacterium]|jgi:starch phosphorylase|nr:alpha-glucan family phosphorylase [Burkholderiales bacterium]
MSDLPGTAFHLDVQPRLPERLRRIEDLAGNLWYSWDRPTRMLFKRLHPALWDAVAGNPRAVLKRVDQKRLDQAAEDPGFVAAFNRSLSAFETYRDESVRRAASEWLRHNDLVAYFCAEFGFHESMPIYSGGLGILAGDHCKAASDMRLPFVAVGLLYRQGYFTQRIDADGHQQPVYRDTDFDDLPIAPVRRADGADVCVQVELPGRVVTAKVWEARVGHVTLYLLDTDLDVNTAADRGITHQLYGGDRTMRIEQEIVLGVGGARALAALDVKPTVFHINEGHAAFLVLERVRALVAQGLAFDTALEAVAGNTVFTTHTPVPAGHDHFPHDMVTTYFEPWLASLGVSRERFLDLGHTDGEAEFNMTALAVKGSRLHNGVSRIHGGVSARILRAIWPDIPPAENPVGFVTNGVHVPTFLAQEWGDVFDRYLGFDWERHLAEASFWKRVEDIPDHLFWSVRQSLKARMLFYVRQRVGAMHARNGGSDAQLDRMLRFADPQQPQVLTIGFARRFATYKRATLLLRDRERLKRIIGQADRPVLFVFAGKAHPADGPGQALIRDIARLPREDRFFEGRVLLVENYDLALARRVVAGVDVWLNNPVYPLEASGTSGMKAGLNGVLNLSVRDGWWDEGYDGTNGWAIKPVATSIDDARGNDEEADALYRLLEDQVIPLYYARNSAGYSADWVRMSKRSMATILPRFSAERQVNEYVANFYLPASRQWRRLSEDGFANAHRLAQWKARVLAQWPHVALRRTDAAQTRRLVFGEGMRVEVAAQLAGLAPEDVVIEAQVAHDTDVAALRRTATLRFEADGTRTDAGEHRFVLDLVPELCGKLEMRIRAYPHHPLLTHPLELGRMRWL